MPADTEACEHYLAAAGERSGSIPGTGSRTIRLLIADDHPSVRESLAGFLAGESDMTVVGACDNGEEAVEATGWLRPDVVLMDIDMAVMDGITATRALVETRPDTRVVLLSARGGEVREQARAAGARGFVAKGDGAGRLLRCVRSAAVGCACCS